MERYIKKVLVPVDGSDSSKRALEMGIALANASGAGITVLEVIEEFGPLPGYYEVAPPIAGGIGPVYQLSAAERVKWVSEQRFEKVHPILDESKAPWDRMVVEGYAADVICTVAAEGSYDMIVIGSTGRSAISRFLLGSVTDRVVHHAPCSVVVVRGGQ